MVLDGGGPVGVVRVQGVEQMVLDPAGTARRKIG